MLNAPELRDVLARLAPIPNVTGFWARAVTAEHLSGPPPGETGDPQPLWTGGPPLFGARYTAKGGPRTLYLAESAEVALLELEATYNAGGRTRLTGAPPTTVFTVDTCVRDMLDLCDPAIQLALGTDLQELTGNWRLAPGCPTQTLSAAVVAARRFDGLVAPSSKAPAQRILAIFSDRLSNARGTFCEVVRGGRYAQRIPCFADRQARAPRTSARAMNAIAGPFSGFAGLPIPRVAG